MNATLPPACPSAAPAAVRSWWWELAAPAIAFAMWMGYLGVWQHTVSLDPLSTTRGLMQAARRSWVKHNLNAGMLPVNTLRDFIRSCEFLGSTAMLVLLGVAGYAIQAAPHGEVTVRLDPSFLLFAKLVVIMALQAFNFVAFMQAVRYLNHVSFLINAREIDDQLVTEQVVWRMLARATYGWSQGIRGLLLTFPCVLWLFGAAWLLVGMLGLVVLLRALDFGEWSSPTSSRGVDELMASAEAPRLEDSGGGGSGLGGGVELTATQGSARCGGGGGGGVLVGAASREVLLGASRLASDAPQSGASS